VANFEKDLLEYKNAELFYKSYFFLFVLISKTYLQLQELEKSQETLVFITKNFFKCLKPKY
jgi:hypothetical protein